MNWKNILVRVGGFLGVVLLFLVISYAFVPEVLSGKIVNQSDISGWHGMAKETMDYNAAHPDDRTAWSNSMFGGMPNVTFYDSFEGDWTEPIYDFLLSGARPASYIFIALLGGFLLMLSLGVNPYLAVAGAIAVAFCSYNMQIIQVGHNTKMQAIAFMPWVLAGLIFTYRMALRRAGSTGAGADGRAGAEAGAGTAGRAGAAGRSGAEAGAGTAGRAGAAGRSGAEAGAGTAGRAGAAGGGWLSWLPLTVLGAVLFAFALSFQIKANHPQITYYLAIIIFLYAIVLFVSLLVRKARRRDLGRFFAASALLLVLGGVGIATNLNKLIPTMAYSPYTMRGGSELTPEHELESNKGLDLDYATAWSYGIEETPNLLIPNFNGGSSSCSPGFKGSETEELLRSAGQRDLTQIMKHLPMYWGPQPFTAGPMYMGAVTVFLFVLGLCLWQRKEKWWLLVATVLAIFLAWGNHFMWFTKLWFDYAPLYNKFRTVSMALVILQVTLPILGFVVLDAVLKGSYDWKTFRRGLLTALGVTGGFCLLFWLFPSLAGTFYAASDSQQPQVLAQAMAADRQTMLSRDAFRSFMLVLAAAAVVWGAFRMMSRAGATGRNRVAAAVGIMMAVLMILDLFPVGKRYLNKDHFVSKRAFTNQFEARPVDKYILQDPSLDYRVLDVSVNTFNDSHPSYLHKSIGGYSPAKLQRYQDLIEKYLTGEINAFYNAVGSAETIQDLEENLPSMPVTSMLNGKYIILDGEYPPVVNSQALGNCWLVQYPVAADGPDEEIALLGDVNLREAAVIGADFAWARERLDSLSRLARVDIYPADSVWMTSYSPKELRYRSRLYSESAVVFSEIYYPEGWHLTIDGQEAELFRADWILRGAFIPAGEHEIVMRYEPQSYVVGERLSRASSITLLILLLLSAAGAFAATGRARR